MPGRRLVNWISNAERMRPAVIAATVLSLCLSAAAVLGQRNNNPPPRPRFAQRQAARQQYRQQLQNQQRPFQNQNRQMQNQQRPYQGMPQNNGGYRPAPGYAPNPARPGAMGPGYNQPMNPGGARPN